MEDSKGQSATRVDVAFAAPSVLGT